MTKWSLLLLALAVGCGSEPTSGNGESRTTQSESPEPAAESAEESDELAGAAKAAMDAVIDRNDGMKKLFRTAYGFAIFPTVGKGGFIVGGGAGDGFVYEQGKLIGTAELSFVSVGAQVGGQTYIEVIFFEDKAALERFKKSDFEFGAQVGAVAVEQGVAIDAEYENGVAVYTLPKKGLMA